MSEPDFIGILQTSARFRLFLYPSLFNLPSFHLNLFFLWFLILSADDRIPPREVANKELICEEGGRMTITTDYLSFTDDDSETSTLLYILLEAPKLGHLENVQNPGLFA